MTVASISLRPLVRSIMKMAPQRQWSEAAIVAQIRTQVPDAREVDVMAAVVWNQGKEYVQSGRNEELECDVWTLTDKGLKAA